MAVPQWLDYNLGVDVVWTFHHVPVSYEWVGDVLSSTNPKQVPSNLQQVLTTGSNCLDTSPVGIPSGVHATRPMMNQSLTLDKTVDVVVEERCTRSCSQWVPLITMVLCQQE